jgi:ankyrin repeat protein
MKTAKILFALSFLYLIYFSLLPYIAKLFQSDGVLAAIKLRDSSMMKRAIMSRPQDVNSVYSSGFTPLTLSAFYGFDEGIRLLLESGAVINEQVLDESNAQYSRTALHIALENGNLSSALIILSFKPDCDLPDAKGVTANDLLRRNSLFIDK